MYDPKQNTACRYRITNGKREMQGIGVRKRLPNESICEEPARKLSEQMKAKLFYSVTYAFL